MRYYSTFELTSTRSFIGPGNEVPPALTAFVVRQDPGAEYVLTVCTGSRILAETGLLDGKKATTNKAFFK